MCVRLLAQLDETENAFEHFWCKHHLKLEQCLQLRHFEQDFREVHLSICLSPLTKLYSEKHAKPLWLTFKRCEVLCTLATAGGEESKRVDWLEFKNQKEVNN